MKNEILKVIDDCSLIYQFVNEERRIQVLEINKDKNFKINYLSKDTSPFIISH